MRIVGGARCLLLAWRNWQTRTAQDRMGRPVEVRVLSRAVAPFSRARRWLNTFFHQNANRLGNEDDTPGRSD